MEEQNNSVKYYTRSNGEKVEMGTIEFTHLSNGYAKKLREIFDSSDKDTFYNNLKEIKDIQEEIYKRINVFADTFEKESGSNE